MFKFEFESSIFSLSLPSPYLLIYNTWSYSSSQKDEKSELSMISETKQDNWTNTQKNKTISVYRERDICKTILYITFSSSTWQFDTPHNILTF